jgi:hypothetical protein
MMSDVHSIQWPIKLTWVLLLCGFNFAIAQQFRRIWGAPHFTDGWFQHVLVIFLTISLTISLTMF